MARIHGVPRVVAIAIVGMAILAAGCGGTPAGPTSGATPGGGQGTGGSIVPGGSGRTPRPRPSGPVATFHAFPDLEARLPRQVGGLSFSIESVSEAQFGTGRRHHIGMRCRFYAGRGMRCRQQQLLHDLVSRVGLPLDRVSVALGFLSQQRRGAEEQALRVDGADSARLLDAYLAVERDLFAKRKSELTVTTSTIGGKNVSVLVSKSGTQIDRTRYVYAAGDVLFEIRRADQALAEGILRALP